MSGREITLFNHANICLNFFNENKGDNADPAAYLGARYFLRFPNNLVLAYISANEVYLYSSDNSLDLNLSKKEWTFNSEAGSWLSKDEFQSDYFIEVVSQFAQHYGKPTLVFPWREWIERYGPGSQDWRDYEQFFNSTSGSEDLKYFRKSKEEAQSSQELIEQILSSAPRDYIINLHSSFVSGDELLPPKSKYSRYRRYCEELESLGWIIIDYMTDQEFAFEALEEVRQESDFDGVAPALIIPLEYFYESYKPSGALDDFFAIIDIGDGNLDDLNCAKDFGLKFEIRHENQLTVLPD